MKDLFKKPSWKVTATLFCVAIFFVFAFSRNYEDKPETQVTEVVKNETPETVDMSPPVAEENESEEMPLFRQWETFTEKDGLPSNKVSTVRIDRGRVWVGTDKGLAIYENGEWSVITTEDGLSHNYVLGIDINELTGEVWIATMSGLSKWSAGEITVYNQFNSGLANDVVYSVVCDGRYVWTATAAGASKFNTYTDQWEIFNEQNAPMHEPWTYGVANGDEKIYIAAWGGGVLEYFKDSGRFRVHKDPDHQMQIDLYPDDGVAHDITTMVSYQNSILWVGTYFGLSRYDGTHWQSYYDHDSGLASNFINFLKAQGPVVYICTDSGFSTFNGTRWATYTNESGTGKIVITEGNSTRELTTPTAMPSNFVWGMDVEGDEIWLATANGVSRSRASGTIEL